MSFDREFLRYPNNELCWISCDFWTKFGVQNSPKLFFDWSYHACCGFCVIGILAQGQWIKHKYLNTFLFSFPFVSFLFPFFFVTIFTLFVTVDFRYWKSKFKTWNNTIFKVIRQTELILRELINLSLSHFKKSKIKNIEIFLFIFKVDFSTLSLYELKISLLKISKIKIDMVGSCFYHKKIKNHALSLS